MPAVHVVMEARNGRGVLVGFDQIDKGSIKAHATKKFSSSYSDVVGHLTFKVRGVETAIIVYDG